MALNYIWVGFFLIAFIIGLLKLIFLQDYEVFPKMMEATFEMAKTGFTLSIGLTGVMTLWLGLMRIGEQGGMITILSRIMGPFFARLFPEVPRNHPATFPVATAPLGLDDLHAPSQEVPGELRPDRRRFSPAPHH